MKLLSRSSIVLVLLTVFAAHIFMAQSVQAQQDFSLVGSWQIDYTLNGSNLNLAFDASPKTSPFGGPGRYIISTGPLLIPLFPTPAVWTQITPELFSFSGEVEYLIGDFARETGTLIFKGKFDSPDSISGETIFIANQPDPASPIGFGTKVGKFSGKRIDAPASDFSLTFDPQTITVSRGMSGGFTVNINRTGGFSGNVTVIAPDAAVLKALKIKLTPPEQSTTGAGVSFNFKIKRSAKAGAQLLTFIGRDELGRVRAATLLLAIQP